MGRRHSNSGSGPGGGGDEGGGGGGGRAAESGQQARGATGASGRRATNIDNAKKKKRPRGKQKPRGESPLGQVSDSHHEQSNRHCGITYVNTYVNTYKEKSFYCRTTASAGLGYPPKTEARHLWFKYFVMFLRGS